MTTWAIFKLGFNWTQSCRTFNMECLRHDNCPSGFCQDSVCKEHPSWKDPCKPGYCSLPYVCDDFTSRCHDPEFPSKRGKCFMNSDCPLNQLCEDKRCVPAKAAGQRCSWTDECKDGLECMSNTCVMRCFQDSDCEVGDKCDRKAFHWNKYKLCATPEQSSETFPTEWLWIGGIAIFVIIVLVLSLTASNEEVKEMATGTLLTLSRLPPSFWTVLLLKVPLHIR